MDFYRSIINAVMFQFLKILLPHIGLTVLLLLYVVAGAAVFQRLEAGTEVSERESKAEKLMDFYRSIINSVVFQFLKILLPHIGLTVLLLLYVVAGAAVFQRLEAGTEVSERESKAEKLMDFYRSIINSVMFQFLKILLPHIGLTVLLLLYVVAGAAVFQRLEAGTEVSERESKAEKLMDFYPSIINSVMFQFLKILLPHIGLTVLLLLYVVAGAAVFQRLEAGTEVSERESKAEKLMDFYRSIINSVVFQFLKILLPHIGLTVLLLLYVVAGAAVFQRLEAGTEVSERESKAEKLMDFYRSIINSVMFQFLKILLPHIGLTVLLLLYVVAGAAVFQRLEAGTEVSERESKAEKLMDFYRSIINSVMFQFLKILLPHLGLTVLLLLYVVAGAAVFQRLEAGTEVSERESKAEKLMDFYRSIINSVMFQFLNILLPHIGLTVLLLLYVVAEAAVFQRLEAGTEVSERESKAEKLMDFYRSIINSVVFQFLKILLPHIGLTVLLLLYVVAGAAVFQRLEAGTEVSERESKAEKLMDFYRSIINLTWHACQNLSSQAEFEGNAWRQLSQVSTWQEVRLDQVFRQDGTYVRNETINSHWTFYAAVLYALTVLTTTGYDHVTPRTNEGKLFAVFFGLVGIPLMFITAADIGKFLSEVFIKAWKKFVDVRRELIRRICCKAPPDAPEWMDKDVFSDMSSETVSQLELPVFAYFGLILFYCAVGGFLYTTWEEESLWTFLHAFHFSFNTITTIGLGNIQVQDASYLCLIVAYVIIGLAVVTMCVDLASSQLKILFSKIHYFGRKMRGARYAFANMSDDLREAMRVIAAIRRHREEGKEQITAAEIRRYLEQETSGGRLLRPFIPQNIHVIRFVDEEDYNSVRSSVISGPNYHLPYSAPTAYIDEMQSSNTHI